MELCLAYKLAEDKEAGKLAKNIVNKISQNYPRYPNLFSEEIHRAFVLTGIILFRDIAPELFTVEEHLLLVEFIEKKPGKLGKNLTVNFGEEKTKNLIVGIIKLSLFPV
ncbi:MULTISPECIES: hypothetical protein [Okeania]|uniref:Uncharacterized protein n=1 Tax=Okeania hirsuta TaxID=1458930 RepID=A0A3N6RP71_9CYAN|nr:MULTISPECIES: hypothetical protein [Okeania]NES90459.1 hypothetical protein [Okeania sp. SIO2B9]RQH42229.1 hypothetical protein D5R40_14860 [Okeania hirsuta]